MTRIIEMIIRMLTRLTKKNKKNYEVIKEKTKMHKKIDKLEYRHMNILGMHPPKKDRR